MCVAMPGKVIAINGKKATVDFSGNTVEAHAGLVSVEIGNDVLVHAGCILQVISEEEGDSLRELFDEMKVFEASTLVNQSLEDVNNGVKPVDGDDFFSKMRKK